MFKNDIADKYTSNPEIKLILVQVLDKLNKAQQKNILTMTHFLNEHQRAVTENLIKDCGNPAHVFLGDMTVHSAQFLFFCPIISALKT